jgi:DNA-binding response OmpR family regulator
MTDGDGNYILHRLRTHSLTERTPVIILTGETNPALKRQLLAQGAEAYLLKPLNLDELLERLRPLVPLACPARLPKLV